MTKRKEGMIESTGVRKAVIPVAGMGTRLLPLTKSQPKEMLPVVDKPAIQYVVEEAIEAGIESVLMVTGRGKRAIEDYFDHSVELEHELESHGKLDDLHAVQRISNMIAARLGRCDPAGTRVHRRRPVRGPAGG
jgi:UTP--glucose-1-phosphate uridylyltransferase